MALGAQPRLIFLLILREVGWLAALGIVAGLGCSLSVTAFMRGLLFGVSSWDVPTLAAAAGLLGASGLLAGFIPAWWAMRVDPMVALRYE
jgi:macrolide transport system ATP-binding/permease protein